MTYRVDFDGDDVVVRSCIPGLAAAIVRLGVASLDGVREWAEVTPDDCYSHDAAIGRARELTSWGTNIWSLASIRLSRLADACREDCEGDWEQLLSILRVDGYWDDDDVYREPSGQDVAYLDGAAAGALFLARELLYDDGLWP